MANSDYSVGGLFSSGLNPGKTDPLKRIQASDHKFGKSGKKRGGISTSLTCDLFDFDWAIALQTFTTKAALSGKHQARLRFAGGFEGKVKRLGRANELFSPKKWQHFGSI